MPSSFELGQHVNQSFQRDEDDQSQFTKSQSLTEQTPPGNNKKLKNKRKEKSRQSLKYWKRSGRLLALIFLPLLLLGSTLISKGSLLLATSQVASNVTLICTSQSSTLTKCVRQPLDEHREKHAHFLPCLHTNGSSETSTKAVCSAVTARWVWSVYLMIISPYFLVILKTLWELCFKSPEERVSLWILLLEGVRETLYTFGITLFMLGVLPFMNDVIQSLALMTGVSTIPGLLRILRHPAKQKYMILQLLLDILAFLAQVSACTVIPTFVRAKPGVYQDHLTWAIPLSLILASLANWDTYVTKDTKPSRITKAMLIWKKEAQNTKIRLFVAVWKCIITFIWVLVVPLPEKLSVAGLFRSRTDCGGFVGFSDVASMDWEWAVVWGVNVTANFLAYILAKFAIKIRMQQIGYALPLVLLPLLVLASMIGLCESWNSDPCRHVPAIPGHLFWKCYPRAGLWALFTESHAWLIFLWWLSAVWISRHTLYPSQAIIQKTKRIFIQPLWGVNIDQWLLHNRYLDDLRETLEMEAEVLTSRKKHRKIRIHICVTMWHETIQEMRSVLKSIFSVDQYTYHMRREMKGGRIKKSTVPDYDVHVFFDDAFRQTEESNVKKSTYNKYVLQLIESLNIAAEEFYGDTEGRLVPEHEIYKTPYGARLIWTLPGKMTITAHLKDSIKIRGRKRWSQVLYINYLLLQQLRDCEEAKHTYILALDGDVEFAYEGLQKLVDVMEAGDDKLGAVCGRIHPKGSGAIYWYQIFEYALGHWLQKATEHVFGCVLCAPGCFSLFRGSALLEVVGSYSKKSEEAMHYIQYDQGEDRWLCTLIIQNGFQITYCAAADCHTHCPEGFDDFFNQRRRWIVSTMANICEIISNSSETIKNNNSFSRPFVIYQTFLFGVSIIGTGTIFLMIVGALEVALRGTINNWTSLFINLIPVVLFSVCCIVSSRNNQLKLAAVLTFIYGPVQVIVLVGMLILLSEDGLCSPTAMFFLFVAAVFTFAAFLHPEEFLCIFAGLVYFPLIPTMYMLLIIFAIGNMTDISWGTRESTISEKPRNGKTDIKQTIEDKGVRWFGHIMSMFHWKRDSQYEEIIELLHSIKQSLTAQDGQASNQTNTGRDTISASSNCEQIVPLLTQPRLEEIGTSTSGNTQDEGEDTSIEEQKPDLITDGNLLALSREEEEFFKSFIRRYPPLESENKGQFEQLRALRNQAVSAFFGLNTVFVVAVFVLQANVDKVSVRWFCGDDLRIEPIGFVFIIIFGVILVIQTLGMLFHRVGTLLHILAVTRFSDDHGDEQNDIIQEAIKRKALIMEGGNCGEKQKEEGAGIIDRTEQKNEGKSESKAEATFEELSEVIESQETHISQESKSDEGIDLYAF